MKKKVIGLASVLALAIPSTTLAAYGTQPGFSESLSHTQCAGAGAFGAFGEHGDYGHDFRGGANGPQTGYNNSHLCGNPQVDQTQ